MGAYSRVGSEQKCDVVFEKGSGIPLEFVDAGELFASAACWTATAGSQKIRGGHILLQSHY